MLAPKPLTLSAERGRRHSNKTNTRKGKGTISAARLSVSEALEEEESVDLRRRGMFSSQDGGSIHIFVSVNGWLFPQKRGTFQSGGAGMNVDGVEEADDVSVGGPTISRQRASRVIFHGDN